MTKKELAAAIAAKSAEAEAASKALDINADDYEAKAAAVDALLAEAEEFKTKLGRVEHQEATEAKARAFAAEVKQPTHTPAFVEAKDEKPQVEFPRRFSSLKHFPEEKTAHRFGHWFLGNVIAPVYGTQGNPAMVKSLQWCQDNGLDFKAQQESTNIAGGALVPTEFDNVLIDLREKYGVFRKYSKVVPMARDTKTVPRRTSGLTAYFTAEGAAITESEKTWDNVELVAKKLATLAYYSSEVAEDAIINMADDLAGEIAYAFANKEDECGFNGDGTSTYGGITGVGPKFLGLSGTIANIAGLVVASGNLYSEIVLGDFNKVVGRLPQYADTPSAAWFVHKAFYHEVMEKLMLASGGVPATEIVNGVRVFRFLGYPVVVTQVMPKVEGNSQICALLGDLSLASRFGDRRENTIAIDTSARFAYDQWSIRGTSRFDCVIHDLGNAHATAASRVSGPIVGLITAAS